MALCQLNKLKARRPNNCTPWFVYLISTATGHAATTTHVAFNKALGQKAEKHSRARGRPAPSTNRELMRARPPAAGFLPQNTHIYTLAHGPTHAHCCKNALSFAEWRAQSEFSIYFVPAACLLAMRCRVRLFTRGVCCCPQWRSTSTCLHSPTHWGAIPSGPVCRKQGSHSLSLNHSLSRFDWLAVGWFACTSFVVQKALCFCDCFSDLCGVPLWLFGFTCNAITRAGFALYCAATLGNTLSLGYAAFIKFALCQSAAFVVAIVIDGDYQILY